MFQQQQRSLLWEYSRFWLEFHASWLRPWKCSRTIHFHARRSSTSPSCGASGRSFSSWTTNRNPPQDHSTDYQPSLLCTTCRIAFALSPSSPSAVSLCTRQPHRLVWALPPAQPARTAQSHSCSWCSPAWYRRSRSPHRCTLKNESSRWRSKRYGSTRLNGSNRQMSRNSIRKCPIPYFLLSSFLQQQQYHLMLSYSSCTLLSGFWTSGMSRTASTPLCCSR